MATDADPDVALLSRPASPESGVKADAASDAELLAQWAPQFVFHPDEQFFPCSVDWYLERTALRDATGEVVYDPIIDGKDRTDSSWLVDQTLGQRRQWHITIDDASTRSGDLNSAQCYAYKRPVTDETGAVVAYDLNYWMFYAFNGNIFDIGTLVAYVIAASVVSAFTYLIPVIGPAIGVYLFGGVSTALAVKAIQAAGGLGMHEGDWEYVVVRVPLDGSSIQQVYMSAHDGEGGWTTNYQTNDAGQPIVYVALNSHANYSSANTFDRLWGLADDHTGNGQAWLSQNAIVDVGFDANATEALSWSMPSAAQFDKGDDPSVAASSTNVVVSVHKNDGKLYYNAGTLTDAAIEWWQPKGTQFDTGHNDPCVAINDDGYIVSLHRSSNTKLYWNAGVFDPVNRTIDWWNGGHGTQYDSGHGDPSVAINDLGVVLSVHQGSTGLYYNAGLLNGELKTIQWANGGHGTQFNNGGSNPAIALNNHNEVVVIHSQSGKLYFSVGVYDPGSQTIAWNVLAVQHDTGSSPAVALNHEGEVIEVHQSDGKLYYNVGELLELDDGKRTINWATATGVQYDASHNGQGVALLGNGSVVEVHRNGSPLYYRLGALMIDSWDNWTPGSDQYWLKYSGRWGKKGTEPIIELGSVRIAEYEDGPIGPAYKGTYVGGPAED